MGFLAGGEPSPVALAELARARDQVGVAAGFGIVLESDAQVSTALQRELLRMTDRYTDELW